MDNYQANKQERIPKILILYHDSKISNELKRWMKSAIEGKKENKGNRVNIESIVIELERPKSLYGKAQEYNSLLETTAKLILDESPNGIIFGTETIDLYSKLNQIVKAKKSNNKIYGVIYGRDINSPNIRKLLAGRNIPQEIRAQETSDLAKDATTLISILNKSIVIPQEVKFRYTGKCLFRYELPFGEAEGFHGPLVEINKDEKETNINIKERGTNEEDLSGVSKKLTLTERGIGVTDTLPEGLNLDDNFVEEFDRYMDKIKTVNPEDESTRIINIEGLFDQ